MTRRPGSEWAGELDGLREWFDSALMAYLSATTAALAGRSTLGPAMRYACEDGKRIRPLLCLGTAVACGAEPTAAVAPALAAELIHCYSLVHDDLPAMDDDAERRGRPTVHVAFGEDQAILAGDALLTLAFEALASDQVAAEKGTVSSGSPPLGAPADNRLVMIRELARAAGGLGMVGGQALELSMAGHAADLHGAYEIARHKTGALMEVACRLGALAAGAPIAMVEAAARFGRSFGFAYQVTDDIGDSNQDAALGRGLNIAIILGQREARITAKRALDAAGEALSAGSWPGDVRYLSSLCDALANVL